MKIDFLIRIIILSFLKIFSIPTLIRTVQSLGLKSFLLDWLN